METGSKLNSAEDRRREGMQMIAEVARRYAHQHGLEPRTVSWEEVTDEELLLIVATESQSVTVPFSADEVEDFPQGEGTGFSKKKIRDKFAGLSM